MLARRLSRRRGKDSFTLPAGAQNGGLTAQYPRLRDQK